ncbi:hypothetical protein SEVIR_4G022532v4 [Setaria viridis]
MTFDEHRDPSARCVWALSKISESEGPRVSHSNKDACTAVGRWLAAICEWGERGREQRAGTEGDMRNLAAGPRWHASRTSLPALFTRRFPPWRGSENRGITGNRCGLRFSCSAHVPRELCSLFEILNPCSGWMYPSVQALLSQSKLGYEKFVVDTAQH